jgi:ribulose kinase
MSAHPVDHNNGQTLDNRRENLAWVSKAQNTQNRHPRDKIPSLEAIVLQLMAAHNFVQPQEVPF